MESKSNTREIKYRLIQKGKIEGYERLKDGEWEWMWIELNPDKGERWCSGVVHHTSTPIIRNQFTGLRDKNGVEIYEGDIVEGWVSRFPNSKTKGVIVYNEHAQAFQLRYENCSNGYANEFMHQYHDFEIIGNIYQTP